MDEIEKAKQELDDSLVVVARSAQELSDNAFANRATPSFVVESADMVDLREQLARWSKATESYLRAVSQKPQAEADAEKCANCRGTGKTQLPAFWSLENDNHLDAPDERAVAYAALVHRAGGFPKFEFTIDVDRITGIEVSDTRTGNTREPTRLFECEPMTASTKLVRAMLHDAYRKAVQR